MIEINGTTIYDFTPHGDWTMPSDNQISSSRLRVTAIDDVPGDQVQTPKVIKNGHILIVRGGKTFNAQGAETR